MAGTFSQIYIQVVCAVKGRESLILSSWEDELYKYITGIVRNKEQKLLAINGMPDHIHFLIGMKPSCCLSDLVREIKKSSNDFIKEKKFSKFKFQWQEGYGAFSVSPSKQSVLIHYIKNQEEHHKKHTFKEEILHILEELGIPHSDEYGFVWLAATG